MPNPENLNKRKSFVKNDPRINKLGRPHKLPELEVILANVLGETKDGKTAAEAILMALRSRAMKGGAEGNRAAELLLNRGYGLPKQSVQLSSDPDNPFQIIFQPAPNCNEISDTSKE